MLTECAENELVATIAVPSDNLDRLTGSQANDRLQPTYAARQGRYDDALVQCVQQHRS